MRDFTQLANKAASHKREAVQSLKYVKQDALNKADELWNIRQEHKQGAGIRTKERELVQGHAFDLFPTPQELAERMVNLCESSSGKGLEWLEPEAGTGRIAQAIKAAGYWPNCIEISYNACKHLESLGFSPLQMDFLEYEPPYHVGCIVMNPPFSRGQDIDHVLHAYKILAYGRITAIMSEGTFYRSDNKSKDFREWLDNITYWTEELEAGTFKASGTNTRSRLVVIDK